jgi:hypothetical protein
MLHDAVSTTEVIQSWDEMKTKDLNEGSYGLYECIILELASGDRKTDPDCVA